MKTGGQILLCAGLKSSGSTWLYNAVIQLIHGAVKQPSSRLRLRPFYAEDVAAFPATARQTDYLIVKAHIPSTALRFLVRFTGGKVFITVREPRDAIASLMQRFDHRFDGCLDELAASAAALLELADSGRHLLFRYETGFTENRRTLTRIASQIGVEIEPELLEKIRLSLAPESVTRKIEQLRRKGVFGKRPNPDHFDPRTHWHPGHVGDRRIGKYGEILSKAQQRAVLVRLREYCLAFGYPAAPPPRARQSSRQSVRRAKGTHRR